MDARAWANADAVDDGCQYAINGFTPAIGVDFFEGPYQDNDTIDNPLTTDVNQAFADRGIPYKGLGIGYGDSIIDNERFGMKRFVYFDRTLQANIYGDPQIGVDFYNYMLGKWRDNTPFVYGGTGNGADANADPNILTNYCFPGDSDPLNWGTVSAGGGSSVPFDYWSEQYPTGVGSSPNPQGDRRFVQAAGPFILEPGALNNITTGVVYARAQSPDPFQSVELVRKARGAEMPPSFWTDPLMYQGGSDSFIGPCDPIPLSSEEWGIDFEGEVAVITGDVSMGVSASEAEKSIRLIMLVNDVSLRGLIPNELAKGFGFFQSKPSSVFSVADIPFIISDATLSVHFDQASTTLLYFSPLVIKPSEY